MIENHDFLFVSNRDYNSEQTTKNMQFTRGSDKMSVATVYLYIHLFILIIYCKICTSSVDNIIFIMIVTQAAEVKWQCANITIVN